MFRSLILTLFIGYSQLSLAQSSFFMRYSAPATAIYQRPVWTMGSDQEPIIATSLYRAGKANPYELALISLDRLGRIKWQVSYQSDNRDLFVSDIKIGPDGGIYVAGMWGLQMSSSPRPFLAAFDAQGRFRWSKTLLTDLVNSKVKIACRANEIGLGFTAIEELYDFIFYRFDYNGNQKSSLRIGGINAEDILVDLQLLPNGNFVALVETNFNNPGVFNAGIIVFNAMSGISGSFMLQGNGNISAYQLTALDNGELGVGLRDAQGYQWLQFTTSGQNLRTSYTIDSLLDFQQYAAVIVQDNFIAQGPIGNSQGMLELIKRGQNDNSLALFGNLQLHSSLSPPLVDDKNNLLLLGTAAQGGADFNEQLIYIKTNTSLDLCYAQSTGITKSGQARTFNRINYSIQAGTLVKPDVVMTWTSQPIQFIPEEADCNTIRNVPLLPTAFSPNRDGLNETFGPMYTEFPNYTLRVYDRWGGLLFVGENLHWDGTKTGEPAAAGPYSYVLDYTDTRGRISRISGQLTLLR